MEKLKDIWLPHIPKNGISTININVSHIINMDSNFEATVEPQYIKCINKNTNKKLYLYHKNPLEKGMEDWLKILVIRNPIDRFISAFNFFRWISYKDDNVLDNRQFIDFLVDSKLRWTSENHRYFAATNHINYLNTKNIENAKNPVVKEYNYDNVFDIFDHIIDISLIEKVYSLIEINFLQKKINWPMKNTAEENLIRLNENQDELVFTKLTRDHISPIDMRFLLSIPDVQSDLNFYHKIINEYNGHYNR